MKKKALLAAIAATCTFAFTAPAFAGAPVNTFSDVPAKHWSYDAIQKLSKEGVVEGYSDGTFRGDRNMTRYEMAQIVANVMTKVDKADSKQKMIIDKLVQEYNADLIKIGARLAKVEAKQNVTFFFDNRIQWNHTSLKPADAGKAFGGIGNIDQSDQFMERIRVYMSAKVGDQWQWDARLVQAKFNIDSNADSTTRFDRFWVTGKDILGGKVEMGKMMLYPGKGSFYGATGDTEGVFYTKQIDKLNVRLGTGRVAGTASTATVPSATNGGEDISFVEATYRPTKTMDIGVYALKNDTAANGFGKIRDIDLQVINGAMEIPNTGGLALSFEYAKNKNNTVYIAKKEVSGYFVAVQSKYKATNYMPALYTSMVNPFVKGDHGWGVSYRHLPTGVAGLGNRGAFSWVPLTTDADGSWQNNYDGVNAWRVDYLTVPWKNVIFTASYDRSKGIVSGLVNNSVQTVFNFMF